jgi:hypothetical protein
MAYVAQRGLSIFIGQSLGSPAASTQIKRREPKLIYSVFNSSAIASTRLFGLLKRGYLPFVPPSR